MRPACPKAGVLVCPTCRVTRGSQRSLLPFLRRLTGAAACLMAILMCVASMPSAVGAEERSSSVIRFYRIYAPEGRMKDWPLGKGKYLPVDSREFERLSSARSLHASDVPLTPSAAIATAEYEAKLVGGRLIGRAAFDVMLTSPAPAFLPFVPCNTSIGRASWRDAQTPIISPLPTNLRLVPGEGQGVRADQPSATARTADERPESPNHQISKLPNSPNSPSRAALGSRDDGRLGVLVERSGCLDFDWSLVGRRDPSDGWVFSLEAPAALVSRLFLELPKGLTPTVDRGLVLGSKPVGAESRRWQIELGGHNRFRLQIVSASVPHPRRQLALLRESRTYDCSLRGVEVSAQWRFEVHNEPLERIVAILDPDLQLISARLGDQPVPWSSAPMPNGAGTRVTLRLPESIRDTDRVIRLGAVGRPVVGRPWRLPRIRAEGLLWQEGSLSLLMPEPLATDRIVTHNCAQTGTGPLSAPRTGQTMQFQSFDADATVEVLLSRSAAKGEAAIDCQKRNVVSSFSRAPKKSGLLSSPCDITFLASNKTATVERDREEAIMYAPPAQQAKYAGTIRVDASVGNRWLREKIEVRCIPQSGQVDCVLVRLFPRRDAPVRWTLGNDGRARASAIATAEQTPVIALTKVGMFPLKPPTETVEPLDDRVSARRWSSEEEAAAGVDPSMETWELALHRPCGSAFEITGVRETAISGFPIAASLAAVPEAASQQGTVAVRAVGSRDIRVDNRCLEPVLPEPPAPGQEQTVRGIYRYDPSRDVALGTGTAIRVYAADALAGPSAWIRDCRLESWHQADGTTRCLATYDLERSGGKNLRLTMPPEIASRDLLGVSIDGAAADWQMTETGDSPSVRVNDSGTVPLEALSVRLPGRRKSLRVTVQWMAVGPALAAAGSLAVRMPEPDLPVLARHWTAWLPPGYQCVDWGRNHGDGGNTVRSSGLSRLSETTASDSGAMHDEPSPDGMEGWTSHNVEVSSETTAVLQYARRASMQLFAAVVFMTTAGIGCWTARKRISSGAVLAALSSAAAAAVVVLPGPYVPIALGGLIGVFFCLVLRWLHRNQTPLEKAILASTQAANMNPGSTIATTLPLGLLFVVALLTLLVCGAALAVDWPPRPRSWPETRPEKIDTKQKSPRTAPEEAVPGSASTASSPAVPPPYRVFVPVDAQRKPVGGKVYVPEALYQELYRHAAAPAEKPPAWLILGATYRGELTKEATPGRFAINRLRVQYDLRVLERAAYVRIPLRTEGANLLPGSLLLDGRPVEPDGESNAGALAFEVAEPGDYRLELSLRPPARASTQSGGFDLAIPRAAASRLDLALPLDAPTVEVPSALGGVSLEEEPRRLSADLGPTDRLTVRWEEAATSGETHPTPEADQLTWLKMRPGSVLVAAKFKLRIPAGHVHQVQLAVDSRLRLLPLPGEEAPTVEVASESGQTRLLNIRWPRPVSDQVVLDATFLYSGISAVGNVRLPQIEMVGVQPGRRWLAVSVDPALDSDQRQGERLETVAVADFLGAWGAADSEPKAAFRLPAGESGWTLSTRPHEPSAAADQTLALSFDTDRALVLFDAKLSVTSGYVFQHRLTAPRRLKIERVSVMQDDTERVQRWSQDDDGMTVFLNGPVSGSERLSVRGELPIRLGEKMDLPTIRVEKCQIRSAVTELYRRPAVRLSVEGDAAAAEPAKRNPEFGRLVKTIAYSGSRQPPVAVTARRSRGDGDSKRTPGPSDNGNSPVSLPDDARSRSVASAMGVVRLADVTLSRQSDESWCGAAAFDIEPKGIKEVDLRLPDAGRLLRASVEDMPLAARRIGDGLWRIRLASPDLPQRIEVLFQGVFPKTDRNGLLCFESPMLGDLLVRRTFWTLLLPSSWTVGEPAGAEVVSEEQLPLPRPDAAAVVGPSQTLRFYVCGNGETSLAIDCREARSYRWLVAATFVLLGIASAGVLTVRKARLLGVIPSAPQ
jgi:hypothetical protein